MKIIILFCLLLISPWTKAQAPVSPLLQKARQQRLELTQKQDELLELLLQVPFEQRQYIFPLLSAKKSVPKKIKTHPEVLVWKGKRPTRIADRFKGDEELLTYLPEQFYYFLSPEAWPENGHPALENNPNQILKNIVEQTKDTDQSVMPEELVDLYDGLNILQNWIQRQGKQPDFPLFFEKWTLNAPPEIKSQIQAKTGTDIHFFSKKLDKITKSYRMYQSKKIPPESPEQKLVQEYWSLLPFLFKKTGFTDVLNSTLYTD